MSGSAEDTFEAQLKFAPNQKCETFELRCPQPEVSHHYGLHALQYALSDVRNPSGSRGPMNSVHASDTIDGEPIHEA
jgi:hypothetical protein